MGSWSVGSRTPGVAVASGRASSAPGCGVGIEAPPVEGAAGVGSGWGTASNGGTGSNYGPLSDGPASSLCSPC